MDNHIKMSQIPVRITTILFAFAMFLPSQTYAFQAKFGVGPDNNQKLLISAINSAKQELLINVYQLDSPDVVSAITQRIQKGVNVSLLVEGSPVGNMSKAGKSALQEIRQAMDQSPARQSHLYVINDRTQATSRRYRFDHAKYLVIDSNRAYITSENFTNSGHAQAGQVGNRGWDTILNNAALAKELIATFETDVDTSQGDVFEYTTSDLKTLVPATQDEMKVRPVPAFASGQGDVQHVSLITSPNSLSELIQVIESAKTSIKLEDMSLPLTWRDGGSEQNPIVTELIKAAQRGVQVQILLNDERVFHGAKDRNGDLTGNFKTAEYIHTVGARFRIPIEARIVDVKSVEITYIHNKGMIIDDAQVLVSSINHTQNAVMNNREVAVLMVSEDAANYFNPVFDFDWGKSTNQLEIASSLSNPKKSGTPNLEDLLTSLVQ